MYETLLNRLVKNKSMLYREYMKLYIPEIVTMLIISFVKVFDKVIANMIGIEVMAGISMASSYSEMMLLAGVAARMVASVEYTKSKDLKVLGTIYKAQLIFQTIIVIATVVIGNILTKNSGLSLEAQKISCISLFAYAIYYILLDYNRFLKIILIADKRNVVISKITIITTIFNVLFDIVVYITGISWVWLVLDNIATELLSIFLTKYQLKDKQLKYGKLSMVLSYKDSMISALVDSGAKRILYILMPFILSWLGDVKYAKYSIIVSIIDQLINPTFNNTSFVVILLNDKFKWVEIRNVVFDVSIKYGFIGALLSVPLGLLFGVGNLNYLLLMLLAAAMIIVNVMQCAYTGLNRFHGLYKNVSIIQIICTISSLLWLVFSVFITGNEYVSYGMWISRNVINIILCIYSYRKFVQSLTFQDTFVTK